MNRFLLVLSVLSMFGNPASAQSGKNRTNTQTPAKTPSETAGWNPETEFSAMRYRNIGPFRGGRVTAVTGIASKPHTFYMGATGGGVWQTDDGGNSWRNITDGFIPVGSIGSIEVAPSDPNVIYVGTGSADPRGNVSIGKGMYRSTDAGKSWSFIGLDKAGQIGNLQIHPQNPDIVYAAALGNPFGHNPERGIYRTLDGGRNWERVLFVNDSTGAMDIDMDPTNPRILYAAMWQVQRKPWTLIDGGPGGGVWKSTDGGITWKPLQLGLPGGVLGKIGIAVSPLKPERVYVLLETPEDPKGGLYRSDDAGQTFTRINGDRRLRMRAWYYNHVYADPKDPETVYVNNVEFLKSTDGGAHFSSIAVLHGDCHDLWVNPENTSIMIHGNDGGAHVTYNGGLSWSTLYNQPTAELYRVALDNQFPYRVYACQQDNTSISVPSATMGGASPLQDWQQHAGGESGYVAVDPRDAAVTYAGNYTGILDRMNRREGHTRTVTHYPQMHDGLPLYEVKYRYQWNAPAFISRHDPKVLYHASQYVHKTTNEGQSWELISPDLTTNRRDLQGIPGGPVQHDYTGVENFTTIFALAESPHAAGELWAGTDDGLLHVTRDGGKQWKNITPKNLPELGTVNSIDVSPHKPGMAWVTVHRYRLNDFNPYVFRTEDYGNTWSLVTRGIPSDHFVRVVREDPDRAGLLYAGTEFGMYISFNGGMLWQPFQLNLPRVPITDLLVKDKDLVISTQGRSFWILDDLSPLHQYASGNASSNLLLYKPRTAYRTQLGGFRGPDAPGRSPLGNVRVYGTVRNWTDSLKVELLIQDATGKRIRHFSTKPESRLRQEALSVKAGSNSWEWNLTGLPPVIAPEAIFSMAYLGGPQYPPGEYRVTLKAGRDSATQTFRVEKDPRWSVTPEDLKAQHTLTMQVLADFDSVQATVRRLRNVRRQALEIVARAEKLDRKAIIEPLADTPKAHLDLLEEELIQWRHQSYQDPINYPPKFDDQIAWLYGIVNFQDARPTDGCYELYRDLHTRLQAYEVRLARILETDLRAFNEKVQREGLGGVLVYDK